MLVESHADCPLAVMSRGFCLIAIPGLSAIEQRGNDAGIKFMCLLKTRCLRHDGTVKASARTLELHPV